MITIIKGKNGIGKSTVFKQLNKDGVISYSPQDLELPLYGSVISYLTNKTVNKDDVLKLMESADLSYVLEWNMKYLSSGNRRFLQSIKYIIGARDAVALDEPTNDLDYNMVSKLKLILLHYSEHKDIYVITHDERLFDLGDNIEYSDSLLADLTSSLKEDYIEDSRLSWLNLMKNMIVILMVLLLVTLSISVNSYNKEFTPISNEGDSYIGTVFSPDFPVDAGMAIPFEMYTSFTKGEFYKEQDFLIKGSHIQNDVLSEEGVELYTFIDATGEIVRDNTYVEGIEIVTIKVDSNFDVKQISQYLSGSLIMNNNTAQIAEHVANLENAKNRIIINITTLAAIILIYIIMSLLAETRIYNTKIQSICYRNIKLENKELLALKVLRLIFIAIFIYYNFLFGIICATMFKAVSKIDKYFDGRVNDKINNW